MMSLKYLLALALLLMMSCKQETTQKTPDKIATIERFKAPNEVYGELFEAVQLNAVFPDSKTFVDCTPRFAPEKILANY